MPPLTRWLIRTALVCFVAGLLLGVAMQARAAREALPLLAAAWPGYVHLLTVGWVTQLIMGVAFWLFPRTDRSQPAPPAWLGWTGYVLLNGGLLMRLAAEPAAMLDPATGLRGLLPLSALLQLAAACCFALLLWPRVRSR
jgi:hypothetical protein